MEDFIERYTTFLRGKIQPLSDAGFLPPSEPHESLKPHQRDIASWAIIKGRSAIFASFGLGKTRIGLQLMKWAHESTNQKTLIVCPLGVRQEFTHSDGPAMGMKITYCRNDAEVAKADTPYIITNYERVRDGNIDVSQFTAAILDEASCLRSYGSETTQMFLEIFKSVPYRWVATATPSPNSYKELIHYAAFLGVMDIGEALTRFFQRDSKNAGNLTLYPHMEDQFWLWVASWALFVNKPSDLGHDDTGYDLPTLNVHWHKVEADYSLEWNRIDGRGQAFLFPQAQTGIKASSQAARDSLQIRIEKAIDVIKSEPDKNWIIWHYLEKERELIEKLLPEAKTVYGSQDLDERERLILDFSNGQFQYLAPKPEIAGSGCNFQKHCSDAIFVAPSRSDKFNDFIQAIHRIYRFLQVNEVNIHIVYADTQEKSVNTLKRKWRQHDELVSKMQNIVKKHGLSREALDMALKKKLGCDRTVIQGDNFTMVHNDCVLELAQMEPDSIGLIVTSIPFSKLYEYSPSFNDFGFNESDDTFFEQMGFLIPNMLRVLKSGRMCCIHVKDQVAYGSSTGYGMYSVNPVSDKTVAAFQRHGFIFCGRISIDTDVVRENAQTYRLGWSENAKDSTKMGCGMQEYVLLFRKWHPSMSPNNTAAGPDPVTKDKETYTRAQWQLDACGVWRDSGNRLVDPDILKNMDYGDILRWWKEYSTSKIYDHDEHLAITQALENDNGRLPASWMLFAPHSPNPDVWTDILRIDTLNTEQGRKQQEKHLCPLQKTVIRRLIDRYSNEGDVVLDPFAGIGSVPFVALEMNRKAIGIELADAYFPFAVGYCEQQELKAKVPTLFDLQEFMVNNTSVGVA